MILQNKTNFLVFSGTNALTQSRVLVVSLDMTER